MRTDLSRRSLLAAVGVAGLSALSGCPGVSKKGGPELTVENRDDERYLLEVYAVPDANTRTDIPFRATGPGGERRYTSPETLRTGGPYHNVTVTVEDGRRDRYSVPPTDTVLTTVTEWESGDAIAALVQTDDSDGILVALAILTCDSPAGTISLAIEDGTSAGSSPDCP